MAALTAATRRRLLTPCPACGTRVLVAPIEGTSLRAVLDVDAPIYSVGMYLGYQDGDVWTNGLNDVAKVHCVEPECGSFAVHHCPPDRGAKPRRSKS